MKKKRPIRIISIWGEWLNRIEARFGPMALLYGFIFVLVAVIAALIFAIVREHEKGGL